MTKIFIGVAWPYANGPLHIGQVAGCYFPPDIFARYHRMKGNEVLMVSGSDMHGTPVTVRAEKEKVSPAEIASRYHEMNHMALKKLGVTFDVFLSTEHPIHKEKVREIFLTLHGNGHIYPKDMTLPYCASCDKYLPDRYVEGICPHCGYEGARGDQCDECGKLLEPEQLKEPRCSRCGQAPRPEVRTHLFFGLSAFEERLKREYASGKEFWRPHVLNFTRNWLEQGLKDRPISRDIDWGIEIPLDGYEDKRIYVWFEAFMGYLTMAHVWAIESGDPDKWREYWQNPDARHYYFLGKDNVPFHTIFWPAVILGIDDGLNLPFDVPANAFLKFKGHQFSKSRGVSLALKDLLAEYDADAIRYYLAVIMPESRDAEFSLAEFVEKNNSELVAAYGNFVHRVISFTQKNFGRIPEPGVSGEAEEEVKKEIEFTIREVGEFLERCEFKRAIKRAMALARFGNQYFDSKAPWSQVKESREDCATTLYTSIQIVKTLAVIMTPFMPHSSQKLWEMLGEEGSVCDQGWDYALDAPIVGQGLEVPTPLFKKLDAIETMEESDMIIQQPDVPPGLELLDLRIARVSGVFDHPNADKLMVLKIDLGNEERQLVAGLKEHYSKEELDGKSIVVVCNLKPAKLRGIESQGMLLAAESDGVVSALTPEGAAVPGERIVGTLGEKQLAFPDFQRLTLEIGADGAAEFVGDDGCRATLATGDARIVPDRPLPPGAKIR